MNKFTLKDFNSRFPNDDACLAEIMILKYGDKPVCPKCERVNKFYKVKGRKVYACACGFQISPLAGTIFEKSTTSLVDWFYAIYIMAQTRAGISAKQLERELGVTYKTAWRMFNQIRKLMADDGDMLTGTVEVDETFVGSRKKGTDKPVVGLVERKGKLKAQVVDRRNSKAIIPLIKSNIADGSKIMTDEFHAYDVLGFMPNYEHRTVKHALEYAHGNTHTNSIEGFWSQFKNGVRGVYRGVSEQHLQSYVDEYAFRYSQRGNPKMFDAILAKLL